MVDLDKVETLLRHLARYTSYLEEITQQDRAGFLEDQRSIGSMRYYLQVSIETCISVGNHIIAAERLRAPRDYRDVFRVLSESGVLTEELSATMRELAGLRNILVHLYLDVDDSLLYDEVATEIDDFADFAGQITSYLARSSSLG